MGKTVLATSIEFLKGVGTAKAEILNRELHIHRFGDLLSHFPYRYIDRTQINRIVDCRQSGQLIQLRGKILSVNLIQGKGNKQRLSAMFTDETGQVELVWFSGIKWVKDRLKPGVEYMVFGRSSVFNGMLSIPHPELELIAPGKSPKKGLEAVYPTTEKAKNKGVDSRFIHRLVKNLYEVYSGKIAENLPESVLQTFHLPDRDTAIRHIHLPPDLPSMEKARYRLKFEELFIAQMRLLLSRQNRKEAQAGFVFPDIQGIFMDFYKHYLPFELTNAQKRVLREIRADLLNGKQMNRLVQGDVGSGKTIVALLSMLMGVNNGFQACLLAPTEILATQHYNGLKSLLNDAPVEIALLTGSTKTSERRIIHENLENGKLNILIGTHALLEDKVVFQNLGIAIIDEQHKFGVAQRARLYAKNKILAPHILVMTATPIPRTLAMTRYGDLDISVIDELPPGRKPIHTIHRHQQNRQWAFDLIRKEMDKGRQAYVVFPLIEGSEKMDYQDLEEGFARITQALPGYPAVMVHGQMKSEEKDLAMQEFLERKYKIMVATTVIEVGVNVPNATVMVIESAERFGLSQLHQLRGRVGRGGDQSYCILLTGDKLSQDGRIRMQTMCETNDGFRIAEVDLKLRGPGEIDGTRQSGDLQFKIADLATDQVILFQARQAAIDILAKDPHLRQPENIPLARYLERKASAFTNWSQIS